MSHHGLPGWARPLHDAICIDRVDPRAARSARDFIAAHLADPELTDLRETAVLLVSEVVTNALRHTDGQVQLEIRRYRDRVRVEVADEASRGPIPSHPGLQDESGRGVPLMDALSDRGGTSPHGAGKVVWFELTCRTPPAADHWTAAEASVTQLTRGRPCCGRRPLRRCRCGPSAPVPPPLGAPALPVPVVRDSPRPPPYDEGAPLRGPRA